MNKSTLIKTIAATLMVVLLGIALVIFAKPREKVGSIQSIDTHDQPTLGKADAKVHIVIFEDLKCVACRNFNNTVLPKIKKDYIDTGIANYTVVNLAFIPGSMPAANAARCLYKENPEWFFKFIDNVYQNQPPENQNWATIPKLIELANVIPNVNTEKLSQCIYESPYTDFIQNNFEQAAKLQGSSVATPAVYVNGRYTDPPTFPKLQKAIDAVK